MRSLLLHNRKIRKNEAAVASLQKRDQNISRKRLVLLPVFRRERKAIAPIKEKITKKEERLILIKVETATHPKRRHLLKSMCLLLSQIQILPDIRKKGCEKANRPNPGPQLLQRRDQPECPQIVTGTRLLTATAPKKEERAAKGSSIRK